MSAREAAAALGISETTVRRTLRQARDATPQQPVHGECHGVAFIAWREASLPRAPWRFTFPVDRDGLIGVERHEDPFLRIGTEQRIRSLRSRIQASADAASDQAKEPGMSRVRRWWRFVARH